MPRVSKKKAIQIEEEIAQVKPPVSLGGILRSHVFAVSVIIFFIFSIPTLVGIGVYALYKDTLRDREEVINQIYEEKKDALYTELLATRIHDIRKDIIATSVIVYDLSRDVSIVSDNANAPLGIASLTKIVLAYVLISRPDYNPDMHITLSVKALEEPGDQGLVAGEQLPLDTALALMLRTSSNDIAYALGETFPGLQNEMNTFAQHTLNSSTLTFKNVSGLDNGEVLGASGTASDILSVLRMWQQNSPQTLRQLGDPFFGEFKSEFDTLPEHTHVESTTLNGVLFSKTGYTDLARGSITTLVETADGRMIALILLDSTFDGRFSDVSRIISLIHSSSNLLTLY